MCYFVEVLLDVFAPRAVDISNKPPMVFVDKRVYPVVILALFLHVLLQILLNGGISNPLENLHTKLLGVYCSFGGSAIQ